MASQQSFLASNYPPKTLCKNLCHQDGFKEFLGSGINGINAAAAHVSSGNGEYLTAAEAIMGRKVRHEKFGIGTIVSVQDSGNDKKLTIAFDKQGVKILLLSFAKLKML